MPKRPLMGEIGALGRLLVFAGLGIAALGGLLLVTQAVPALRMGRLPGDVHIQRDGLSFYFPVVTMLLLSLLLTVILWLIGWLRR